MKVHSKSGLFYRPGTADSSAFNQVETEYLALVIPADSLVLDIGAHIGFFTKRALDKGATHVVSIEPDPGSFEYLSANFANNPQVTLINIAIAESSPVTLYQKKTSTTSTIIPGRKTSRSSENLQEVEIKAVPFIKVLDFYKPSVVKVDVEAAELFWNWDNIPDSVRHLALEVTLRQRKWRSLAEGILENLQSQGFEMTETPDFDSITFWNYSVRAVFKR
jgi:FkbM family methyltransferase